MSARRLGAIGVYRRSWVRHAQSGSSPVIHSDESPRRGRRLSIGVPIAEAPATPRLVEVPHMAAERAPSCSVTRGAYRELGSFALGVANSIFHGEGSLGFILRRGS